MAINFKDKDYKITVRLTKKQLDYLDELSKNFNSSKSDILRMLINLNIYNENKGGRLYEYE